MVEKSNMEDETERKLVSRLRRLAGQIRALEIALTRDDQELVITQFEAVIAAAKASLTLYLSAELLIKPELSDTDRKTLDRLIKKFG
jgi:DNA-binding FrmR family transcriptional regulator